VKTSSRSTSAHRRNIGDQLRLRHLRMLELIDQGGSLVYAARALHLTQPAVTKLLHDLEDVFGVRLVDRGPRGGHLTPAGHAVMGRLKIALEQFDAAADAATEDIPSLRIGILPAASMRLLVPAVARLRAQGTAIRFSLYESTIAGLLDGLTAGRTDCVIARVDLDHSERLTNDEWSLVPLMEDRLAIAAAIDHPIVRSRRKITLAQLTQVPWVVARRDSNTRQAFDRVFVDAGLRPPIPMVESPSLHTNLRLVSQSDMLALVPESAIDAYARLNLVARVRSDVHWTTTRHMLIASKATMKLPALSILREALEITSANAAAR
jgi:DNA-binding transcriptional LysR family regulator